MRGRRSTRPEAGATPVPSGQRLAADRRRGEVDADLARTYGPILETHANFPERTNVQFLEVLDRKNLRIEIRERGAGCTLASGSSSCAAAAVARKRGWCAAAIVVHMPGGR